MTDFILDDNGKVSIGESTRSHQQDLLILDIGWHKFSPTRGVGVMGYIHDESEAGELRAATRREFERDGMDVNEIGTKDGKLVIDAKY